MTKIFGIILILIAVSKAQGASFDCGRAKTTEEKVICSDARLSAIDELIGQTFSRLLEQTSDKDANLANQRLWIKTRQASCQSLTNQGPAFRNCLRVQTSNRLHQLTDRLTLGIATASKPQIGRCRMDGCTWFHVVDKRALGQKGGHDLIEVESTYGESGHPPGSDYAYPNYPNEYSLDFKTKWISGSARTRFYCNPKKPVVIFDDDALLLSLHAAPGVHQFITGVWTHACYSAPSLSYHSEQWLEANGIVEIVPEEVLSDSEKKQFLNWVKSFAKH